VLSAASAVVTTSAWTRDLLLDRYRLPPEMLHVAEPGVDPAGLSTGSAAGGELLCVAAVAPHKGHDVLFAALTMIVDLSWRCVCVGTLDRDPGFVHTLCRRARAASIEDRVSLVGTRTGADLAVTYAAADLLVLASRAETYGMVVTEALARGLPVLATRTGGVPEALGRAPGGTLPGLLVTPDDPAALADGLSRWLDERHLRDRLRRAAALRRPTLPGWDLTATGLADVLARVGLRVGARAAAGGRR
jgi:glycosyltransferase involved in cell wall biosynthesis